MTLVFTTVFTSFELLFLCSWDYRIWGLHKMVFRRAGKLCACYHFQSYANRQPRLRYKTNLSWDFALMLTWSDVLTFVFQALPSSVLAVTCRDRSRTWESHYNTLKLQFIYNWSTALAGVQRSYNFLVRTCHEALLSHGFLAGYHMTTHAHQVTTDFR